MSVPQRIEAPLSISTNHFTSAANKPPRLLISVRDAAEALAAADGGADIIDIKEPRQGSLGRAATDVIAEIHQTLQSGGRFDGPISAACGELHDLSPAEELVAALPLLRWVKVGLSGCRLTDWQPVWRQLQQQVIRQQPGCRLLAVVYADGESCGAPEVEAILEEALATDTPGVLFDTFEKRGRSLLEFLPPRTLQPWIRNLQAAGRFVALAGSVDRQHLPELAALAPDIIAVRSAVCVNGRTGCVQAERVAAFRAALHTAVG